MQKWYFAYRFINADNTTDIYRYTVRASSKEEAEKLATKAVKKDAEMVDPKSVELCQLDKAEELDGVL